MPAKLLRMVAIATAIGLAGQAGAQAQGPQGLDKISHILVLYMENRSFDNMFGEFPGANGIANAGESATQRDRSGKAYEVLPASKGPFDRAGNPPELRSIPTLDDLPNRPLPRRASPATLSTPSTPTARRSTTAGTTASRSSRTPTASPWAITARTA
jgi:phospholipase C